MKLYILALVLSLALLTVSATETEVVELRDSNFEEMIREGVWLIDL
jgi:hypothetical protein